MKASALYDVLAGLLKYPGEDYPQNLAVCAQAMTEMQPDITLLLVEFSRRLEGLATTELQELYTQTFDLNPVCSLEVGWHLFGENYERGEFLVKMRQQLRRFALPESSELPDHLTHVLAVLGRMEPEEADEFASACVFPALDKMRAGLQGKDNLFEDVLQTIGLLLESRHPRPPLEISAAAPVLRVWNERGSQ